MKISVECPNCHKRFTSDNWTEHKRWRCNNCKTLFVVLQENKGFLRAVPVNELVRENIFQPFENIEQDPFTDNIEDENDASPDAPPEQSVESKIDKVNVRFCPLCHQPNSPTLKYCSKCYANLDVARSYTYRDAHKGSLLIIIIILFFLGMSSFFVAQIFRAPRGYVEFKGVQIFPVFKDSTDARKWMKKADELKKFDYNLLTLGQRPTCCRNDVYPVLNGTKVKLEKSLTDFYNVIILDGPYKGNQGFIQSNWIQK